MITFWETVFHGGWIALAVVLLAIGRECILWALHPCDCDDCEH